MFIYYYCPDCGSTFSFNELKKKIESPLFRYYYACPKCDSNKFELYGEKAPGENK